MSDDRKLESLKSLQLEIKSKLNLLATRKAYEDEKNRHIQELSFAEKELDNLIAERNRAEEELKIKSAEYEKIKIEVVEIQKRFEVISGQRDYDALTKLNADAQASLTSQRSLQDFGTKDSQLQGGYTIWHAAFLIKFKMNVVLHKSVTNQLPPNRRQSCEKNLFVCRKATAIAYPDMIQIGIKIPIMTAIVIIYPDCCQTRFYLNYLHAFATNWTGFFYDKCKF